MKKTETPKDVDEYIHQFPDKVQLLLQKLRKTIKDTAPGAEEVISYQMPAYKCNGILLYFAGYKKHIGFYPASNTVFRSFKEEIANFYTSKSTLQFSLDKPLPLPLIKNIITFRLLENEKKIIARKSAEPLLTKASEANTEKFFNTKLKKTPVKNQHIVTDAEQVAAWLYTQEPAVKTEIDAVRKMILKADIHIAERIKWNAPSYHYNKQDILTFGPYKKDKLLLVFHHPAVVKITSALLQGNYKDRRLVYFKDKEAALKNKKELIRIITEMIAIIKNT